MQMRYTRPLKHWSVSLIDPEELRGWQQNAIFTHYSLSTIGRWCSKFISRNSYKNDLGWNCALIEPRRSENFKFVFGFQHHWLKSSGDVWNHIISVGVMCLLSAKNVDISLTVFLSCFFFPQNIRTTYTERAPLSVLPCS